MHARARVRGCPFEHGVYVPPRDERLYPFENAALPLQWNTALCLRPEKGAGQRTCAGFFVSRHSFPLSACAGRRIPQSDQLPQEQRLWNSCEETIPANADGFQHFVCADVHSKRWEVLIRKEPK